MRKSSVARYPVAILLAVGCCALAYAQVEQMVGVSGGSGGGFPNPGTYLAIDPSTGAATVLGTPYGGSGISGVATSSTGRVFAITSVTNPDDTSHLIELDPQTGALLNDVGPMFDASGNGCGVGDLSFQPGTDVLFAVASNQSFVGSRCGFGGFSTGGLLLTVDTTTAQYTLIGRDARFGNQNGGLAFAPDGTLYFVPGWGAVGSIYTLDPTTANVLTTQALTSGQGYMGLGVRPSDGTIFASHQRTTSTTGIFTIDPVTGADTLVGGANGILVHDVAFVGEVSLPVPMLSPWAVALVVLLLAAVAVVVIRLRLS